MIGMRACERCGARLGPLRNAGTRYCSGRCQVAAHRAGPPIPARLTSRARWVRYSASKVPLQVDGRPASSTDSATWATFAEVRASSVGVGFGFVLDGDGLVCIDLDHALADGELLPWAADVLEAAPATWVEVSPSGEGLHVWGFGSVERGRRFAVPGGMVEVYGTGRYITVTGRPFAGSGRRLGRLDECLGRWL